MMKAIALIALLGIATAHNIKDHGAITDDFSDKACIGNAAAFQSAIKAAQSGEKGDRTVYIDGDSHFCFMPSSLKDVHNVEFIIDGKVTATSNNKIWPARPSTSNHRGHSMALFDIEDSSDLKFRGEGHIDGQGFDWWVREILVENFLYRPCIFEANRLYNFEFSGILVTNAPYYHFWLKDIDNVYIHDMEIYVDIWSQKDLHIAHGNWNFTASYPIFPLNTDGIDPSGTNVVIENVKITNYDDAVAVKPAHNNNKIATCAQNITVNNATVINGVGMTIGSVPPSDNFACVRDVSFSNVVFWYPIKAIYVKTNPGNHGSGIIANIHYENITMHYPIWWAIYIGPQQQEQPDGVGPGCMLYPLVPVCETQPRVPIQNVTLKNVYSHGGILPPGIIRCNETAPCHGFEFENVNFDGWFNYVFMGYITENVYGVTTNSYPDPGFISALGPSKNKKKNK